MLHLKAGMGTNFRRLRRYRPATYVAKLKIHVHVVLCIYPFFVSSKCIYFLDSLDQITTNVHVPRKCSCLSYISWSIFKRRTVGKNIFLRENDVKILRINTKLWRMNAQISRIHAKRDSSYLSSKTVGQILLKFK